MKAFIMGNQSLHRNTKEIYSITKYLELQGIYLWIKTVFKTYMRNTGMTSILWLCVPLKKLWMFGKSSDSKHISFQVHVWNSLWDCKPYSLLQMMIDPPLIYAFYSVIISIYFILLHTNLLHTLISKINETWDTWILWRGFFLTYWKMFRLLLLRMPEPE